MLTIASTVRKGLIAAAIRSTERASQSQAVHVAVRHCDRGRKNSIERLRWSTALLHARRRRLLDSPLCSTFTSLVWRCLITASMSHSGGEYPALASVTGIIPISCQDVDTLCPLRLPRPRPRFANAAAVLETSLLYDGPDIVSLKFFSFHRNVPLPSLVALSSGPWRFWWNSTSSSTNTRCLRTGVCV